MTNYPSKCDHCHLVLFESEGLGYNDTTPGLCAKCDWTQRKDSK